MRVFSKACSLLFLSTVFLHDAYAIGRHPPDRNSPLKNESQGQMLMTAYRELSRGMLDEAATEYGEVLADSPHEIDALLGLAVIYQRRHQPDLAAKFYRQALNEDMGNAPAAAGLISLSIPADPAAAESELKELLDIQPSSPELQYALGNALAFELRMGEAEHAYFIAYTLAPDNALYAYNLAVSLDRLHKPHAALPYYEKSLRLSMQYPGLFDPNPVNRRIREISGIQEQKR